MHGATKRNASPWGTCAPADLGWASPRRLNCRSKGCRGHGVKRVQDRGPIPFFTPCPGLPGWVYSFGPGVAFSSQLAKKPVYRPMSARIEINRRPRRKVAIRRDSEDFVIAFQPEDIVVFRHAEARALRKACVVLRWEVVGDTVAEANNPASW